MTRVHVFCEGQTEEAFVRNVLAPAFHGPAIHLNPILVRTSRQGRGGVVSYGKIRWQLLQKCREDPRAWVTTMLDWYRLPKDFPRGVASHDPVASARQALEDDLAERNFIGYLQRHEFEALLFSDPQYFRDWYDGTEPAQLQEIRDAFASPEDINDGPETSPSRRIGAICRGYQKTLHGALIAESIGLETMRRECPVFDQWLKRIEVLAQ